jgi:hypothetical protein
VPTVRLGGVPKMLELAKSVIHPFKVCCLHRIRIKRTAGVKLPFNPKKSAILPKTIKAHLLIAELQAEGRRERCFPDDDEPRVPDPLDSAQARRAQEVSL